MWLNASRLQCAAQVLLRNKLTVNRRRIEVGDAQVKGASNRRRLLGRRDRGRSGHVDRVHVGASIYGIDRVEHRLEVRRDWLYLEDRLEPGVLATRLGLFQRLGHRNKTEQRGDLVLVEPVRILL